ncbi:unnamed protein product [Paramecium sonneborni]|uniref:Uncharacterized protein n=1 Tax=Paramecium sonneborni TaxID=65129 RepID=A0A8S1QE70_9CILI|nr:unnamed protein product [Paramecium sonneborni]
MNQKKIKESKSMGTISHHLNPSQDNLQSLNMLFLNLDFWKVSGLI